LAVLAQFGNNPATEESAALLLFKRCSAIAERPRCRMRYSSSKSERLELRDNILRTL